jgi:c-di-GMP-binding flagellar brake protein YcgR
MPDILNYCRMLFKNREHKRYNVQSGTFVIIAPGTDGERKVQIVDISMGGAAFIYNGRPDELEQSGVISMLTEKESLKKLEFETVSDVSVSESAKTSKEFRRRGVKFKWLGVLDKAELSEFIEEISTFPK